MNSADRPRAQWLRRAAQVVTAAAAAVAVTTVPAPAAHADAQYPVAWTKIGIYPQSAPSMGSGQMGKALSDGQMVTIVCEAVGKPVFNGDKSIDVWERLADGTWLPNAFMKTGHDGWTPGIPNCTDYLAKKAPNVQDAHADPKKVEQNTLLTCSDYIAEVKKIPRDKGVTSIHVVPTQCGRFKSAVQRQAAFDELYHEFGANWSGDLYWSLHNQFDCHAIFATWKDAWNLETNVPNIGFWPTFFSSCGDDYNK